MTEVNAKFVSYQVGQPGMPVLVDAVHATNPSGDLFTGEIAEAVADRSGVHLIVGRVSRDDMDLNRPRGPKNAPAVDEYRAVLTHILEASGLLREGRLSRPILHLAVHGMKDTHGHDIELGTRHGDSCSASIQAWTVDLTREWIDEQECMVRLEVNRRFPGDLSLLAHREGDDSDEYKGWGANFNSIQIEFARWLRERFRESVIQLLSKLGGEFSEATPDRWT